MTEPSRTRYPQPRFSYIAPQQHGFPHPTPAVVRRRRIVAIGIGVVVAAVIAVTLLIQFTSIAANFAGPLGGGPLPASVTGDATDGAGQKYDDGETGEIDLASPVSPFDESHPAIARLDPELREAVQQATIDAEAEGVVIELTSGWRSADYQASLLSDAIVTYGSESAAREFVNTPEDSKHVTGEAVDIAQFDSSYWVERYGNEYGLCRTYANESWHFELATTPGGECPQQLLDASSAT